MHMRTSPTGPDVAGERERLVIIASILCTAPECWRDCKLIIACEGV